MSPQATARKPRVDLDGLAEKCEALKLTHAAAWIGELVDEAARDDLAPLAFFERVLEREIEQKNERRIATSLKLSGLPVGKTLEGFDWTFQPRIDRTKIEALATCAYLRAKENVLLLDQPGVGKDNHATALGGQAVLSGFTMAP